MDTMSRCCLIATGCAGSGAALVLAYIHLRQERWVKVRRHPWASVRYIYQSFKIYQLAWRLDRAYSLLPVAVDAQEVLKDSDEVLDRIFAEGPETFQEKPSNRKQIESLMDCVYGLVQSMRETGTTPLLLDMGAGKALFSRALYEALDRKVAVVAMDIRGRKNGDHFYDPPPVSKTNFQKDNDEKPFTRIVANVHGLSSRTIDPTLHEGKHGGVICIAKHLCGGATDGSIKALCASPLEDFVGACCLAPCCHQKTRKEQYCNPAFLESQGLCRTHIGLRGGVEDPDFRTFGMLISMSKSHDLKEWEYKKSALLKLLGPSRAQQLGFKARRILEEGRIQYLRANGFEAHLVRYCDSAVTFDNLAIIATRYSSRTPD